MLEKLNSLDDTALLGHFNTQYSKVLDSLDQMQNGVDFDPDDSRSVAALALLAQAALIKILGNAELRARGLKRDIDFAKAKVYARIKDSSDKKVTEVALTQQINIDPEVNKLYQDQNVAEKEAKELANILALLKDAHVLFRSISKGE